MRTTRSIGALAAVALLCAMVAGGAATAASPTSNSATTFSLYSGDDSSLQEFRVRNADQDRLILGVAVDRLTDDTDTRVGKHHWQCMRSDFAWSCTGVIVLNNRADAGAGTITLAGLFEGFNGESLAITGGTGTYAGAAGTVKLTSDQGRLVRTVKLLP